MMLLKNVHDINMLIRAIDQCKGDVILRSIDGSEEFNMKSKLSQYIAIERLHRECGDEYEIFCLSKTDEGVMLKFFYDVDRDHAKR